MFCLSESSLWMKNSTTLAYLWQDMIRVSADIRVVWENISSDSLLNQACHYCPLRKLFHSHLYGGNLDANTWREVISYSQGDSAESFLPLPVTLTGDPLTLYLSLCFHFLISCDKQRKIPLGQERKVFALHKILTATFQWLGNQHIYANLR